MSSVKMFPLILTRGMLHKGIEFKPTVKTWDSNLNISSLNIFILGQCFSLVI